MRERHWGGAPALLPWIAGLLPRRFGDEDLAPRQSQGPLGDGCDALCDQATLAKVSLEHGAATWSGGIDSEPLANTLECFPGIRGHGRAGDIEPATPFCPGERVEPPNAGSGVL